MDVLTNSGYMFSGCDNLSSFSSYMPLLTNGEYMFNGCSALSYFRSDLSSLANGNNMFYDCRSLSLLEQNLSFDELKSGYYMFYKTALPSFDKELPKLEDSRGMFSESSIINFKTPSLPSLQQASNMFFDCFDLKTIISDFSSLVGNSSSVANNMFEGCKNFMNFDASLANLTDIDNMGFKN